MPTEVYVPEQSRKEYIESLKKQLPPKEVEAIERSIDERVWLINHPRNRVSRIIHRFARWIEYRK